jgi:SAM-dependent methyltransferase
MNAQDDLNRRTWTKPASIRWLDRNAGFIPGEERAFDHVRKRLDGRPILEIGVGTGRTIGFTRPLAAEYLAIDYLPAMVETCKRAHPDVAVELGDARTLDGLEDGHYGLVTFAFNGIDAVSHGDRARVLDAVHRVLGPGGIFFFSTLNLDGPETRERPWQVPIEPSWNPFVLGMRAAKAGRYLAINLANWARMQPMIERGPGYSVAPLAAHDFGILAHYTSLAREVDELDEHGFSVDLITASSGSHEVLEPHDDTREVGFFHLVATKRR